MFALSKVLRRLVSSIIHLLYHLILYLLFSFVFSIPKLDIINSSLASCEIEMLQSHSFLLLIIFSEVRVSA